MGQRPPRDLTARDPTMRCPPPAEPESGPEPPPSTPDARIAAPMRLRARTSWTVLGQGSYMVTQLLILVLLTQLEGIADVGRFGLATAIVTPVYWLLDLGLRTSQTTDVASRYRFRDFLLLRLLTALIGIVVIALIGWLYLTDAQALAITLIFGLAKGVETLSEISYGVFERHGAMRTVARSMTMRGVGSLAAFGLLLAVTGSPSLAFVAQLLVWSGVLSLHDLPLARAIAGPEPGRVRLGALLATALGSWQLGASQFFASLQTSVPRFVIDWALGIEAVGVFTAIAYLLQASNMTVTAVSRSILGHLAELLHEGRSEEFRRILWRYGAITCGLGFALLPTVWLVGAPVMGVLFGPEFLVQRVTLFFMALTAVFRAGGILLQTAPLARRRFDLLLYVRVADLMAVTALTGMGVVLAALPGAALGMAAASLVQMLLLLAVTRQVTRC